jgi:beta-lactamase superfamily II metal-dependent hydrolase
MTILHFLNVGQGDCSIIWHATGRVSMVDVCRARRSMPRSSRGLSLLEAFARDQRGEMPAHLAGLQHAGPAADVGHTNPIDYLRKIGVVYLHRFILTHPDMDHMDGLADLIDTFPPLNFWDTANIKAFTPSRQYRDEDWRLYLGLRDGLITDGPTRLILHAGDTGAFWNRGGYGGVPHDDLHVLAPTPELISAANRVGDWNDASYVLLQLTPAGRILFWGDAHDRTRAYVVSRYADLLRGVEIMIAPHHGRDSNGDRDYLSIIQPRLTLFGCAPSQHLAYDAWYNRDLRFITNTQAGNIVVDSRTTAMAIYVENEAFARKQNAQTFFDPIYDAWFLGYFR